MSIDPREKVVMFIDGANLYATSKAIGVDIDYRRLLAEFQSKAYLLRAFLEMNPSFEIVWFQDYLAYRHRDAFLRAFPRSYLNFGGNIWLRRVP